MTDEVTRALQRDFGDRAPDAGLILAEYGRQPYEREVPRVHAAILYLAKGDLAQLRYVTDCACTDYRDVLTWAEYPDRVQPIDTQEIARRLGMDGR